MSHTFANKLVLYNYFRSSTSYRARIALHWKSLEFEYKPVHLLNHGGEQNRPEYRNLNPAGEVPTLIHGHHVLGQSMAILQYLDDVFPQNPLFPRTSGLRSKVIEFCEGINCAHSLTNLKVLQFLDRDLSAGPEAKERWTREWMTRTFESCEKMLHSSAGTFCFGGEVTAAECFLIPHMVTAQRFQVDTTRYPLLTRIFTEAMKLSAFRKAHPFCQVDTPAELRKSF